MPKKKSFFCPFFLSLTLHLNANLGRSACTVRAASTSQSQLELSHVDAEEVGGGTEAGACAEVECRGCVTGLTTVGQVHAFVNPKAVLERRSDDHRVEVDGHRPADPQGHHALDGAEQLVGRHARLLQKLPEGAWQVRRVSFTDTYRAQAAM